MRLTWINLPDIDDFRLFSTKVNYRLGRQPCIAKLDFESYGLLSHTT